MIASNEASQQELKIRTRDGLDLHARHWQVASPRGVVVISHGFGEHGGSYDHVARAIAGPAGVDVLAFDYRGHGLSPGRRGVVKTYDDLLWDLLAAFDRAGAERPGLPRFLLGHSNGGQVVLRAALDPRFGDRIAGLILSNPTLKLAFDVPRSSLLLGQFLMRFFPWLTLAATLDHAKLTRDPEMQRQRREDPLCHDRISPPLFFGMVEGGEALRDPGRLAQIDQSTLMLVGDSDPIVDPAANCSAFADLGASDRTLNVYPGVLHEPLNDLGREQVFADLIAWLDRHS